MGRKTAPKTKVTSSDHSFINGVHSDDPNHVNARDNVQSESVTELLDFYASIPDYGEVDHLSDVEFYNRLQALREKRRCYISKDAQIFDRKINAKSPGQEYYTDDIKNRNLSFPRKKYLGLCGKKCEIHLKGSDMLFGDTEKIKTFRNRNPFLDEEFKTDRFISTPETFSVLSSDAGLPSGKSTSQNVGRKPIIKYKYADGKQLDLMRVESCSSVAVSEKSIPENCNKFECLSESDSAPPFSHPYFRGSKILKRPKSAITTSLSNATRKKKLWTQDLNEQKFDKSRYIGRQGKSILCQSIPDLRDSLTPFKAKSVSKIPFHFEFCPDESFRSPKKKYVAEEFLRSPSLTISVVNKEKCTHPTSPNLQSAFRYESECSSSKGGKCSNVVTTSKNCDGDPHKKRSSSLGFPSTSGVTSTSSYDSLSAAIQLRMKAYPQTIVIPSKNNLAAILRIQSTRQKLERDLEDKLAELKRKEDACIKAHLARQQPAWQAIQYSTEEDLALRRIIRKQKEKRHLREHQKQMNLMLARVQQIPPLFERQAKTCSAPHYCT